MAYTGAMTLAQYGLMSNDALVREITYSLIKNGSVLDDLPLVNKKTMVQNGVRFQGNLPAVNWGPLNSDPVIVSGTPTAFQEQAYILREKITADRFLVEDENSIGDPLSQQIQAALEAVNYDINDKFINGDHKTDANSLVGLKSRLAANVYNNGVNIYGCRQENLIDAAVDLSGTITAAQAIKFLEVLDQLIWAVDGAQEGMGVYLYMNEVMKRKFASAIRALGINGFEITKDAYNRYVTMFRGAVVRDIGYKADQATRIIPVTENAAGAAAGGTYTSIYAAHMDTNHLFGWQFDELEPKDIGLIGSQGSHYSLLLDWAFGFYNQHTRSMARAYDIKVA